MTSIDFEAVIHDLESQRDAINDAIRALRRISPAPDVPPMRTDSGSATSFAEMTRTDAAYAILAEAGTGLTAKEIVRRLLVGGFTTTSKKPHDSMRSALRRDARRFCQRPPGTWRLVEWDHEQPNVPRTSADGVPSGEQKSN
ncbi:MAG: winged helix-turn-helix domain-containing protein [Chloroflexi bacterium]|nr:winged helix-turn-helix domain-containing protein [Chloroflexota bacterium]